MTRLEAFAQRLTREMLEAEHLAWKGDDRNFAKCDAAAQAVAERLIREFVTDVTTPAPDPEATENKLRAWLEETLLDLACEQVRKLGPEGLRRWFARVRDDERLRVRFAAGIITP